MSHTIYAQSMCKVRTPSAECGFGQRTIGHLENRKWTLIYLSIRSILWRLVVEKSIVKIID